jgi:hypothetical protein
MTLAPKPDEAASLPLVATGVTPLSGGTRLAVARRDPRPRPSTATLDPDLDPDPRPRPSTPTPTPGVAPEDLL